MQYAVKQGQSIYDVAILVYGSPLYAVKLADDNDISLTDSLQGLSLFYDESIKESNDTAFNPPQAIPVFVDNNYTFSSDQSIFDVSLMWGYGVEKCTEFFTKIGVDLNTTLTYGIEFNVPKEKSKLQNLVTLGGIIFATNVIILDYARTVESGEFRLTEDGLLRYLE